MILAFPMSNLASNLVGRTVNGWNVLSKLSKADSTGGNFSSGYIVRHDDGTEAFMKAINIGYALSIMGGSGRPMIDIMNDISSTFRYERDLLDFCGKNRMDHIVVAIDSGEFTDPSDPYFVPYLVFELCKSGDLRRHEKMKDPGLAWRFKIFHGVCVGMAQLHGRNLAHQDLKPSNVLVFAEAHSKIADLGRSTLKGPDARFAQPHHMGDLGYCPIELQYGHYEADWDARRKGADLYMLGGIFAFLAANIHIFGLVFEKMPEVYRPRKWKGSFSAALPVIRNATHDAIEEVKGAVPTALQPDVGDLLSWLCEPEPTKRGHPKTISQQLGDRFSLERIISFADNMARKARLLK
jgi:serine/threonine protein kinase